MRAKCTAEESVTLKDIEEATGKASIINIIEDEEILVLSAEEEVFLSQQNIDNDTYYDAKKAFLFDGEKGLGEKLRSLSLDDAQYRVLFDFIIKRN